MGGGLGAVNLLRRTAFCAALLLLMPIGAAPAGETVIVIGAAVSLSGKYALNGKHTKNGYDLAAGRINAQGGIAIRGTPHTIVIKYYDDQSTPARGTELAERLIRQDGVKYLLGPFSSGLTKAILPVAEKYGTPMIEANGAARELFNKGYRNIFAVLSTSDQYMAPAIELAAEHAEALGKKPADIKFAIAMENDPFAQDVRAGVLDDIERLGMRVVIDDRLPPDLNDMSVTLTKVKALRPDVLIVSGHEKGAMTAVTQLKSLNVHVPVLALTHCDSAQLAERSADAEFAFCAMQWDDTLDYKGELFTSPQHFAVEFKSAYGYEAPYQAAQSAAAVEVFADAFKRAQSLDPKAIRDAIAATELETFYGKIKFDETGRNIAKSMILSQVRDGDYVIVWPPEHAKAKPVMPRPRR